MLFHKWVAMKTRISNKEIKKERKASRQLLEDELYTLDFKLYTLEVEDEIYTLDFKLHICFKPWSNFGYRKTFEHISV